MIKLKKYQRDGVKFVREQKRGLIVLGVGKGKTEIALRAAEAEQWRTMVVCPKSLEMQWHAANDRRIKDFIVVPYSSVEKNNIIIGVFKPDLVIADEPKMLKSHTKTLEAMLKVKSKRKLVLDATPIENKFMEVWFLFRWLKPKLFGTLQNFREMFGFGGRLKNMKKFREMIAPHIFRPVTEETRPRDYYHVMVEPDFDRRDLHEYEQLCKTLLVKLKRALRNKSLQALNRGFGNISKLRSFLGDPEHGAAQKLRALRRILKKLPDFRGVIFCYRRDTARMIKEHLHDWGIHAAEFTGSLSSKAREKLRTAFNTKALQFLVATSAGERGIDLPTGNIVVHFDLPWTRASYDQRDRVSRLSSDRSTSTSIITLILRGTIEEVMWSIIVAKRQLMIKPFDPTVDTLIITRKSWVQFLEKLLGVKTSGRDVQKSEDSWFSRGFNR